jgi:hypothetical protein
MRFQAAALKAALGWDIAKSRSVLHGMSTDAGEYLAASRERGDVYVAGRTEEHEPGGVTSNNSFRLCASGSRTSLVNAIALGVSHASAAERRPVQFGWPCHIARWIVMRRPLRVARERGASEGRYRPNDSKR